MVINLDRLTLRHPQPGDARAVSTAVRSSLAELAPWMPWATADYNEVSALAWINGEFGDVHRFVVVVDDTIIGSCGINQLDEQNQRANLGYWIRSDMAGLGYATRAAAAVARYGIEQAGLQRLEIMMSIHNEASRRVAEKAGAQYEGLARERLLLHGEAHDAHCYSIVRGDLAAT